MTIKFEHAVYDTFTHQSGEETLAVGSEPLRRLLMAADSALDREPGFFFDTIDDNFVFGFERMREDKHGRKRGMAYFDLFVTPATNVADIHPGELKTSLEQERVPNYETQAQPTVEITLRTTSEADDSTDSSKAQEGDPEPVDTAFVAEAWELYRRRSAQLRLSLHELDSFVSAVDGLLPHLSYVCRDQGGEIRSDYFDVIDGKLSEAELESSDVRNKVESLQRNVDQLEQNGTLAYDELPTYRDELEDLREKNRVELRGLGRYGTEVETIFEEATKRTQSRFETFPETGIDLMDRAIDDGFQRTTEPDATEEESASVFDSIAVDVLVLSIVWAVVSGIFLGSTVGSILGSGAVSSGIGAVIISGLLYRSGWFEERVERERRIALNGFLLVGVSIVFFLGVATVMTGIIGDPIGFGIAGLGFSASGFLSTLFALLGGFGMIEGWHRYRSKSEDELGDGPSLVDDSTGIDVDENVVVTIDETLESETESVQEWIETDLVQSLEAELQSLAEEYANETATQSIERIAALKDSEAYSESALSENDR